jgi:hypothetical protein
MHKSHFSREDELNQSFYEYNGDDDNTGQNFEEELTSERAKTGLLTEKLISENLSNFGKAADGTKFAYLNLSLPGCNLVDIKALAKYKELQSLELSHNKLSGN